MKPRLREEMQRFHKPCLWRWKLAWARGGHAQLLSLGWLAPYPLWPANFPTRTHTLPYGAIDSVTVYKSFIVPSFRLLLGLSSTCKYYGTLIPAPHPVPNHRLPVKLRKLRHGILRSQASTCVGCQPTVSSAPIYQGDKDHGSGKRHSGFLV